MADNYEKMEELKDGLDYAREQGDAKAESSALYGIGKIYAKDGIADAAEDFWGQCEAVCRNSGQEIELAQVLIDLGDLASQENRTDRAEECFAEALGIYERLNELQGRARVLERLAALQLATGKSAKALEFLSQGMDICREHEDRIGGIYFLEQMIPLYKQHGTIGDVDRAYRELITLCEKIGDRNRMAMGLVGLADVYQKTGRPKEAVPYLTLAHDIFIHLNKDSEAGMVREELRRLEDAGKQEE